MVLVLNSEIMAKRGAIDLDELVVQPSPPRLLDNKFGIRAIVGSGYVLIYLRYSIENRVSIYYNES